MRSVECSKNSCRSISDFKNGDQPRTCKVKDEKDDLVLESQYFGYVEKLFLSVFKCTWDKDVRRTEIHTAEPLVPEPSAFEVEMVIENLKGYKSPGVDHIAAEPINISFPYS
jgi:hypothetical protein